MKEKGCKPSLHWNYLSIGSELLLAYHNSSLPSLYFSVLEVIKCQSSHKKLIALANKMFLAITAAEKLTK